MESCTNVKRVRCLIVPTRETETDSGIFHQQQRNSGYWKVLPIKKEEDLDCYSKGNRTK